MVTDPAQRKIKIKCILFAAQLFLLAAKSFSQKIVIRPGAGFSHVCNAVITPPGEKGFQSETRNFNFIGNLSAEFYFNDHASMEAGLHNGIIGYSYRVQLTGSSCRIVYRHFQGIDVMQLNVNYNWFSSSFPLIKIFKDNYSGILKLSAGAGLNRLGWSNQELNENAYYYRSVCPGGLDSMKATTRLITKTSGLGGFLCSKIGLRLLNSRRKELFDLSVYYNLGLTRQYVADIDYFLNDNHYSASLAAKGTQLGFIISVPVTIRK
jgi:hypothetical protein